MLSVEERVALVKEVGEEIVSEEELVELFSSGEEIVAYDGFEPSGILHIAQGPLRATNVNKMIKAGVRFKMLVADWHAWANNKAGGVLEDIQTIGKYQIEMWKACGIDMDKVEFVWASELVKDDNYWKKVMEIAINNSVKRIVRCSAIMGRNESDNLSAAQILYACMQCADIFELGAKITQLGMDQRKVNMLAREVGPKLGFWKPVVVSHHMIAGLVEPENIEGLSTEEKTMKLKMSKSNPNSAIFMSDEPDVVRKKINKAHCPAGQEEGNPLLEWCKYFIFHADRTMAIERPEKFGGNVTFETYDQLRDVFISGDLHPADLKQGLGNELISIVEPVREYFTKNKDAAKLESDVKKIQITR